MVRICLVSEDAVFLFSFSSQIAGLGAGLCSHLLREIKNVFKGVNKVIASEQN